MNKGQFQAAIQRGFSTLVDINISDWSRVRNMSPLQIDAQVLKAARQYQASYKKLYLHGMREGYFNFQLNDFSYFQFFYEPDSTPDVFRYAFYPNPFELPIEVDEGNSDQEFVEAELSFLRPLIRFDYEKHQYRDGVHAAAHMHVGSYPHCRIPVRRIWTPDLFIYFVTRHYYYHEWLRGIDLIEYDLEKDAVEVEYRRARVSSIEVDDAYFSELEKEMCHVY